MIDFTKLSVYERILFVVKNYFFLYDILIEQIKKSNVKNFEWMLDNIYLNLTEKINGIKNYPIVIASINPNKDVFTIIMKKVKLDKLSNFKIIYKNILNSGDYDLTKVIISKYEINDKLKIYTYIIGCKKCNLKLIDMFDIRFNKNEIINGLIFVSYNYKIFEKLLYKYNQYLTQNNINKLVIHCCSKGFEQNLKLICKLGYSFLPIYYDDGEYPIKILQKEYDISKNIIFKEIAEWMFSIGIKPGIGTFYDLYIKKITM